MLKAGEKTKAFAKVEKHWTKTLHDPSADIKTGFGDIYVYLHRIFSTKSDAFRPQKSLYFPYGLHWLSSGGRLPTTYLYFTATMPEKVENPENRKHFLLSLYLPGIEGAFIGGDTFNSENRRFEEFYPENSNFQKRDEGGLIAIPDGLELTQAIEVSIAEITQNEWEKGPWRITDLRSQTRIAIAQDVEDLALRYPRF